MSFKRRNSYDGPTVFVACLVCIICIVGWVTHVVVCFKTSAWIVLFIGALFFPIGIMHGILVLSGML